MEKNPSGDRFNFVYADGKRIGRLSQGVTKTFDVKPGTQSLEIRSGLLRIIRSNQINISIAANAEKLFLTSFTEFSKSIFFMIIPVMMGILFIPLVINGSLLNQLTEDQ